MRIGVDGDVSRRSGLVQWAAQIQGMQTSLARLSSGLRINSAVDDAAELAIAERMRSHVLGARQTQHNAQDGINLLRVADGALGESMGLLQRMRVIAVQAANGTWSDAQRSALQGLMDESIRGIDEIARMTQYNTIHLLDGSRSGLSLQVGSMAGDSTQIRLRGAAAQDLGLGSAGTSTTTYEPVTTTTADQTVTTTTPDQVVWVPGPGQQVTTTTTTNTYSVADGGNTATLSGTPTQTANTTFTVTGSTISLGGTVVGAWSQTNLTATMNDGWSAKFGSSTWNGGSGKGTFALTVTPTTTTTTTTAPGPDVQQVIPGTTTTTVIPGTTTTTMVPHTTTTPGTAVSVVTADSALDALRRIDAAMAELQDRRTEIGAAEVGLNHTISELGVQEINLAAAEGRIRDVDVTAEAARLARIQASAAAGAMAVSKALVAQFGAVETLLGTLPQRGGVGGPRADEVAAAVGRAVAGPADRREKK